MQPVGQPPPRQSNLRVLVGGGRVLRLVVAREQEQQLLAVGVEEDSEQHLGGRLEECATGFLAELSEKLFGQVWSKPSRAEPSA